jgi:hypothetical protein
MKYEGNAFLFDGYYVNDSSTYLMLNYWFMPGEEEPSFLLLPQMRFRVRVRSFLLHPPNAFGVQPIKPCVGCTKLFSIYYFSIAMPQQ